MRNQQQKWTRRLATGVACGLTLFVGQPMWTGTFDSPSGSPPYGFAYSSDASGQQYTGTFGATFFDYRQDGTASSFDLIMRLRKGNALHNFTFADDCTVNACGACQPDPSIPAPGLPYRINITLVSFLQACVETQLADDVKQAFGLAPSVQVRLKSTSSYLGEEASSDPTLFLVVSDVELTAK